MINHPDGEYFNFTIKLSNKADSKPVFLVENN